MGTKKTLWVNFQEICQTMGRSSDHVFQFMMAELGTEGSIDGNKRLVIRGKFVPKVRPCPSLSWIYHKAQRGHFCCGYMGVLSWYCFELVMCVSLVLY